MFSLALFLLACSAEAGYFLPRNPVQYFFHNFLHRVSFNVLPSWCNAAYVVDSAGPICLVALILLIVHLRNGNKRKAFLNASTLALFAHTAHVSQIRSESLEVEMREFVQGLPHDVAFDDGGHAPFSTLDFLLNSNGGAANQVPIESFVYKTVTDPIPDKCESGSACDFHFFPGDSGAKKDEHPKIGHNLFLDVYASAIDPSTTTTKLPPLLLHIHGGGWRAGTRRFFSWNYRGGSSAHFVERQGYVVASISYRLTNDGWSVLDAVEDVSDALDFARAYCDRTKRCDSSSVGIFGTSAGGHLALMLGYTYHAPEVIKGVLDLYGPTELRPRKLTSIFLDENESTSERAYAYGMLRATASLVDSEEAYDEITPLRVVEDSTRDLPPTLVFHGKSDGLVSPTHAYALGDALRRKRASVVVVDVDNADHDFDTRMSSPGSQMLVYASTVFWNAVFTT